MDSSELTPNQLQAGLAYYMLHGRSDDCQGVFMARRNAALLVKALSFGSAFRTEGIDRRPFLGLLLGRAVSASTTGADWFAGSNGSPGSKS